MIIPEKAETAAIRELLCKVSVVILIIAQWTGMNFLSYPFYVDYYLAVCANLLIGCVYRTVNSEIFTRILFSRIWLKDTFAT